MNYLQLSQSLMQKCGISGSGLTTVTGQTGEAGRVTSWINEAYLNIQLAEPTWNWMRNQLSFVTTSGKYAYTPAECGVTDLGGWKMNSFRRYITSTGVRSEAYMTDIKYDAFRDTYLFGNMRLSTGDPRYIAEGPDLTLNLGLIPGDVGYTVVGEYYRAPSAMVLSADLPLMPAQFHMIVVYRAMMMYGMYESAAEVLQEGQQLYSAMLRRLMRDQMDDVSTAPALA